MKCMMTEITAKIRSRWMRKPALLNMTKPPSHAMTRTTARIRNMGTLPLVRYIARGASQYTY